MFAEILIILIIFESSCDLYGETGEMCSYRKFTKFMVTKTIMLMLICLWKGYTGYIQNVTLLDEEYVTEENAKTMGNK